MTFYATANSMETDEVVQNEVVEDKTVKKSKSKKGSDRTNATNTNTDMSAGEMNFEKRAMAFSEDRPSSIVLLPVKDPEEVDEYLPKSKRKKATSSISLRNPGELCSAELDKDNLTISKFIAAPKSKDFRFAYRFGIALGLDFLQKAEKMKIAAPNAYVIKINKPTPCLFFTFGYAGFFLDSQMGLACIRPTCISKAEKRAIGAFMCAMDPKTEYNLRANWWFIDAVASEATIIQNPSEQQIAKQLLKQRQFLNRYEKSFKKTKAWAMGEIERVYGKCMMRKAKSKKSAKIRKQRPAKDPTKEEKNREDAKKDNENLPEKNEMKRTKEDIFIIHNRPKWIKAKQQHSEYAMRLYPQLRPWVKLEPFIKHVETIVRKNPKSKGKKMRTSKRHHHKHSGEDVEDESDERDGLEDFDEEDDINTQLVKNAKHTTHDEPENVDSADGAEDAETCEKRGDEEDEGKDDEYLEEQQVSSDYPEENDIEKPNKEEDNMLLKELFGDDENEDRSREKEDKKDVDKEEEDKEEREIEESTDEMSSSLSSCSTRSTSSHDSDEEAHVSLMHVKNVEHERENDRKYKDGDRTQHEDYSKHDRERSEKDKKSHSSLKHHKRSHKRSHEKHQEKHHDHHSHIAKRRRIG